ncbi:MAG TPA: DUF2339 domain-containing protein, partial [Fimbriimonadaceae bacterium]|nr:DUF2339 domain-containing protein [Fimbriimonadaceae bacterium]
LSLAGGHLVQNLFSSEVLVASFVGVSFANLLYGLASKSKAFLTIGIIGGLVAALLPLQENKTVLNGVLTLAIVLPAAYIAARRRWPDMAALLWIGALGSLVPLMMSTVSWEFRVGVVYAASLAAIAAFLYSAERLSFDGRSAVAPALLFASALIGFAIEHNQIGVAHLAGLAAGAALVSLAAQAGSETRRWMTAASVLIPLTVAPYCFTRAECLWILMGLTAGAAILSSAGRSRLLAGQSLVYWVLSLLSYLTVESWSPLSRSEETRVLLGLIPAAAAAAYAAAQRLGKAEPFTIGVMALMMPLVCRLGIVAITGSPLSSYAELSGAQSLALFALAAVFVARRTRWVSALAAMWLSLGVAVIAYIGAVAANGASTSEDVTLILLLAGTAVIGLPVANGTAEPDFQKTIMGATGVFLGFLAMRLGYVVASLPQSPVVPAIAATAAAALYALGASGLGAWKKSEPALITGLVLSAASGVAYLASAGFGLPPLQELGALTLLAASVGVAAWVLVRIPNSLAEQGRAISALAGCAAGFLAMRFAYVAAGLPQIQGSAAAATVLAAAIFSCVASAVGLKRRDGASVAISLTLLAAAAVAYVASPREAYGLSAETVAMSAILAAFVMGAASLSVAKGRSFDIWHGVALLGWVVISRWVDLVLVLSGIALHGASTMTIAWILYALILLSLGFRLRIKELRLWSFAVMFATVTKILLVDLASTPTPFRVTVLLGLGFVMLGGGYWYIRDRHFTTGLGVRH